uniref:Ig-like domain-containing protein n=1 Tax=Neogobius melanostomus TaxID=47308 RepID=A0A8C6TD61_9GOBI
MKFVCALDACGAELYVTTPGHLEALSGSCVQIPCNFTPSSNNLLMFLNQKKDCTTLFSNLNTSYSDLYYFRIETDLIWPQLPSIKVSGEQTETKIVTITCSAVTPCPGSPPQLTWDLHQGTSNITETNPDGTLTTVIKLNITLTDSHDGLMIKCSAVYPVSGGVKATEENVTLNVTYGPKDTSVRVSPSGTLSTGQSVTLSCSSRANPAVQNFTWFRHSSQGPVSVSKGDTFSFNFSQNIHGQYYCEAKNRAGKQASLVIHVGPGGNTSWLKVKYITTTEDKLMYSNWPTASNTLPL